MGGTYLTKAREPATIGGPCEDVDWECMVSMVGASHTEGLLNTEADKVAAMDSRSECFVQVDRWEEGRALGPQPGQLVVSGDLHIRAAACIGLPVLHIVVPKRCRADVLSQDSEQAHLGLLPPALLSSHHVTSSGCP